VVYRMAPVLVTVNDHEGHSPVAGLFKCNPSNIYAVFYQISTDSASRGPSATAGLLVFHKRGSRTTVRVTEQTSHIASTRLQASSLTCRIRRVCCHSNETIANPPNSEQLGAALYRSSHTVTSGYIISVDMRRGTDGHTDTQTAMTNIHFTWPCLMRNVANSNSQVTCTHIVYTFAQTVIK